MLWFLYCFIAWIYYAHGVRKGSWWSGIIVAIFWPLAAGLWLFGAMLVWMEDRELKRLVRRDIYDEDWWV